MKNSIRRLLSLAMVLILILSTATVLSGCIITKSAKMKYVEGTYKLTTYSGNSDWLTERGIELIMVIRADGTGYYGYRSNDAEPFISELRCNFLTDPEESGKYQYVEIDFEGKGEYHKLGINADFKDQNLISKEAKWKGNLFEGTAEIDYYIDVGFTRIDKATDRSIIDERFSGAPVLPYGIKKYVGAYHFTTFEGGIYPDVEGYVPPSPLVYFYLDLDFYSGKATAYYMLKSNEEARVVTCDLLALKNEQGTVDLHIGEIEAKIVNGEFYSVYIHIPRQGTEYFKLDYIGTTSPELLTIYCENDYASYLSELDVSQ